MASRSEDVKTPLGLASFTKDLFEARERDNGGKGYGLTILFDKPKDPANNADPIVIAMAPLRNAAVEAAKAEWGDKAVQWIKDGLVKSPFLDGDGKQGLSQKTGERHPGYAGRTFIRCTSGEAYKPKVFDKRRNPVMTVEGCTSGSTVFAVVNAYTWENEKNGKGISFGISLVQVVKLAEGADVLGGGGGADPDKWLETIEDEGDAPPSTKSGDGAAGLFS
jgi:hypothetical protein